MGDGRLERHLGICLAAVQRAPAHSAVLIEALLAEVDNAVDALGAVADHLPVLARDRLVAHVVVDEAATGLRDSQLLDHDAAVLVRERQRVQPLHRHIRDVTAPLRLDRMQANRDVPLRKNLQELLLLLLLLSAV